MQKSSINVLKSTAIEIRGKKVILCFKGQILQGSNSFHIRKEDMHSYFWCFERTAVSLWILYLQASHFNPLFTFGAYIDPSVREKEEIKTKWLFVQLILCNISYSK